MLANVSFGILVFHPVGWALMFAVVALEGFVLQYLLFRGLKSGDGFVISAIANVVSGLIGFAVSLTLNGGWWLVVWVPWVTANEASSAQRSEFAVYLAVAWAASTLIELVIAVLIARQRSFVRVAGAVAAANLLSSLLLLATFWTLSGVPGLHPPVDYGLDPQAQHGK